MRTIETKVYNFEELSKEAQQKAIEKYSYINVEYFDWYESTIEVFKEQTKDFEVDKVYFSGFYSQGDGAMFEYSDISKELFAEAVNSLKLPNYKKSAMIKGGYFSGSGSHSGHYSHEKCCYHNLNFEANDCEHDNINDLFYTYHRELEDYITEKYESIARQLYRELESENDYLTSEEAIKETLIANEYEFTEEGVIH